MFMSPYLAVAGTMKGAVASGLAFWGLFMVTSIILGRAACGYICPLGGLQDCVHSAIERPLVKVRYLKATKYGIWGLWMFGLGAAAKASGGWHRFDLLFQIDGGGFPPYHRDAYVVLVAFMLLAAIPAFLMGRRAFCHHLCFFAPLNIIGSKLGRALRLPALRVSVADSGSCKDCKACDKACPMSLDVSALVRTAEVEHTECIACGSCSAACRFETLEYGFDRPRDRRRFN
jgi:ferredoxin-type protein NapH